MAKSKPYRVKLTQEQAGFLACVLDVLDFNSPVEVPLSKMVDKLVKNGATERDWALSAHLPGEKPTPLYSFTVKWEELL